MPMIYADLHSANAKKNERKSNGLSGERSNMAHFSSLWCPFQVRNTLIPFATGGISPKNVRWPIFITKFHLERATLCCCIKDIGVFPYFLSPLYYPRPSPFDDFEDVAAGQQDEEMEEDEGSRKWHQKLLKSASGVLLPRRGDTSSIGGGSSGGGQESPSQCVIAYDQRRGVEAEEYEDADPVCETVSLTSVSSPLTSDSLAPPPNQVTLTHSLVLAMTLILLMHAMIANLWCCKRYGCYAHWCRLSHHGRAVIVNKALSIKTQFCRLTAGWLSSTHDPHFPDFGHLLF